VSKLSKLQSTLKTISAYATVLAVSPLSALALGDTIDLKGINNPNFKAITEYRPSQMITAGLNILLIIAALVSFAFLLFGGIQWILAGGDKDNTEKARKRITNALIGLAIVFSAYAITFIINALFGVNIFQLELKQIGTY